MSELKRCAVVSVFDKTNAGYLLDELAARDWMIAATRNTGLECSAQSHSQIISFEELIAQSGEKVPEGGREQVAQAVARIIGRQSVGLVCVNLRPPELYELTQLPLKGPLADVDLDKGGLAMLDAACKSGTLTVTEPGAYQAVLEQLDVIGGVDTDFAFEQQRLTIQHSDDYLAVASALSHSCC